MMPPLIFVLATARGGALGHRGTLPWHKPEDLAHFRRMTLGHAVIMGRRTWSETGEPLSGRRNIVVTRQEGLELGGAEVARSLDEAIERARTTDPEPRVIGGAEIFRAALPQATKIYLTEIALDVEADTFFTFDRTGWRETERRVGADPTLAFVTLERVEG